MNFQELRNPNPKPLKEQEDDEKVGREAKRLALLGVLPMVLRFTIELGLIDVLQEAAKHGGAFLSPSDIALRLPCVPKNPKAPELLSRVLRLLATCSVVECCTVGSGEKEERVYRAKPICRFLVKDGDQEGSLGPLLLLINDISSVSCWSHVKEAILEGGSALDRATGMSPSESFQSEERTGSLFDMAMSNASKLYMTKLLEVYDGFRGVNVLVDVGGATGATLGLIAAKYPHIKAINFDLPNVVSHAPPQPGMEHVGGDMFVSVPQGDAIILKHVLHNWSDENSLKILRNCWKALPNNGKVIVIESVFPKDDPKSDSDSDMVALEDMVMLAFCEAGRERTKTEFEALALNSGFAACELICSAYNSWILEFQKSI